MPNRARDVIELPVGARERDRRDVLLDEVGLVELEESGAEVDRISAAEEVANGGPEPGEDHAGEVDHRRREVVDRNAGVGNDLRAVSGDLTPAVDVPAARVRVVVPELRARPGLSPRRRGVVDAGGLREVGTPRLHREDTGVCTSGGSGNGGRAW